jgi:hypothetical protein
MGTAGQLVPNDGSVRVKSRLAQLRGEGLPVGVTEDEDRAAAVLGVSDRYHSGKVGGDFNAVAVAAAAGADAPGGPGQVRCCHPAHVPSCSRAQLVCCRHEDIPRFLGSESCCLDEPERFGVPRDVRGPFQAQGARGYTEPFGAGAAHDSRPA